MSIEQIEKGKAKTDLFIFVIFVIWIASRILGYFDVDGLELVTYFASLIVILSAVIIIMQYMYYSIRLKDELDLVNKFKAYKFSWIVIMISAILLYITCKKTSLTAQFSIELILWIGYLSYFLAFKFFDAGLDAMFSNKLRKVFGIVAIFCISLVFGMNFGYKIPEPGSAIINENKVLFYIISGVIIIIAVAFVIKLSIKIIREEKEKEGDK